jgi:hypothetical protein
MPPVFVPVDVEELEEVGIVGSWLVMALMLVRFGSSAEMR